MLGRGSRQTKVYGSSLPSSIFTPRPKRPREVHMRMPRDRTIVKVLCSTMQRDHVPEIGTMHEREQGRGFTGISKAVTRKADRS